MTLVLVSVAAAEWTRPTPLRDLPSVDEGALMLGEKQTRANGKEQL